MLDPAAPWPYVSVSFDVERGPFRIACQLAPACNDITLVVHAAGELVYELSALVVEEVRIHSDPSHHTLEVVFSDNGRLFVRLDPALLITQSHRGDY